LAALSDTGSLHQQSHVHVNDYVQVRATVRNLFKRSQDHNPATTLALILCAVIMASVRPAFGHPSYHGEYVVTLRPQSAAFGRVGALSTALVEEHATVVEHMRSNTLLVSSLRRSSANQIDRLGAFGSTTSSDDELCKRLLATKVVDTCTPNYKLSISQGTETDPLQDSLWGMSDESGIGAVSAWGSTTGSSDVVVAVIDTGVDYNHEDLLPNMWINPGEVAANGIDDDGNGYIDDVRGINLSVGAVSTSDPMDDNQHGTHVAGTIAAVNNNGLGVRGVSSGVKLLPIKFMDSSGSGRLSDAIAAIDYMVDLKVNRGVNIRVANNSWGGGGYSPALEAAIRRANDAGILFVVAAGNSASDIDLFPAYPASYEVPNVVTVAAIDQAQNLASFSNYGAVGVDIAAPGVDITSTLPGQRYGALSGTSMAAPHIAGSLALLVSVEPQVAVADAISRLLETGREVATLASSDGSLSYVRSRRIGNAARLIANQRVPLTDPGDGLSPCGYQFQVSNVVTTGGLDDAADRLNPINQVDEGDFRVIALPFDFPFFRTKTRVLYVSPNGLVYLNPPRGADYQVAARAPNNSIAAFHADLTPRNSKQGVRAFVGTDRAVIYWLSEHYSLTDRGPVAVRLTLHRSGLIRSTVSFEAAKDPLALSWLVLGNGFASPPTSPLGLIGASATSSAYSSTVDIAAAQRGLVSTSTSRVDLSVAMVPNCFEPALNGPPEQELQIARVDAIKMKVSSNQRKVAVQLRGVGSGKIPVRATINGRWCSQIAWGSMAEGVGSFQLSLPKTARKIALHATESRASIQVRQVRAFSRREKQESMCAQLLQAVR
jgi:subtilisin family serine protease